MTEDAKKEAWQRRCSQLEALGIDPYAPQVPADHPHHSQIHAILAEYKVAIGEVIPVPQGWEGNPPLQAITNLAELADWLRDQWTSTLAIEMGGERFKTDALDQAARAVRNGFRVLAWLGMDDRLERPQPAETLAVAKQQLDDLERWVRQKVKDGWTPPKVDKPHDAVVRPAAKRRKRAEFPDEYELNLLINQYFAHHPGAPIRDVVEAVGLSQGKVQQTEAWRREMARRKATKPLPKRSDRRLTRRMLETIGREDDPAIKVMKDEAIWRWVLETAQPKERAELHMKTAEERAKLVELVREQYDEAHAEPDD